MSVSNGVVTGLLLNLTILLSMVFIYSLGLRRLGLLPQWQRSIVTGLLFGGMGSAVVFFPVVVAPGVIIDLRMVVIGLAALFLCPPAVLITLTLVVLSRIVAGGVGVSAGIGASISAAVVGLAMKWLANVANEDYSNAHLLVTGLALGAVTPWWALTIPNGLGPQVFTVLAPSLLVVFPLGMLLAGTLLRREHRRRLDEAAVLASEEKHRELLHALPAPVVSLDHQWRVVFCNQAFGNLFDPPLSPERLQGRTVPIVSAADRRRWRRAIQQVTSSGEMRAFEGRMGDQLFAVNIAPSPWGVIVVGDNITEERQNLEARAAQQRFQTMLSQVTLAALSARSSDEMTQLFADQLGMLFNADGAFLTRWDAKRRQPMPAAAYGNLRDKYRSMRPDPDEPSLTAACIAAGHPIAIDDLSTSDVIPHSVASQLPSRALLGIPLVVDNQPLGAIIVAHNAPHAWTPTEVAWAEQMGQSVALAIARQMAVESAEQRAQEAETLRKAALAVTSGRDLRHVLDSILAELEAVVAFDSACIFLVHEAGVFAAAGRNLPNNNAIIGKHLATEGNSLQEAVIRDRQLIVLDDASADPRFGGWGNTGYIRGWMAIPLVAADETIGYLTIDSSKPAAYTTADANLASAFASQAAIAIQNARLFNELSVLATTDELTQVYNRRHFSALGLAAFDVAQVSSRPLAALLFDLDHFKRVNDTYGHAVGDAVLREIVNRVRSQLPERAIVGRYGGEEFAVALPETALPAAADIAEAMRHNAGASDIVVGDVAIRVTISLGVAHTDMQPPSFDRLLDLADAAMYAAKQAGRNCVRLAAPVQS